MTQVALCTSLSPTMSFKAFVSASQGSEVNSLTKQLAAIPVLPRSVLASGLRPPTSYIPSVLRVCSLSITWTLIPGPST